MKPPNQHFDSGSRKPKRLTQWFGNDLEGRRLRRPRYRGEQSPLDWKGGSMEGCPIGVRSAGARACLTTYS
jgi:hypothetical protein